MNMDMIFKLTQGWNVFKKNHPKFPMFLQAVKNSGIKEGDVVAISITSPDGNVLDTNIKVTSDDIALFQSLRDIKM